MAGGGGGGGVPGTYNDGGYWGNDLDHVLQVVAMASHSTACELLHDAVENFQENGFQEWQLGPPNTTRGSCMYLPCHITINLIVSNALAKTSKVTPDDSNPFS